MDVNIKVKYRVPTFDARQAVTKASLAASARATLRLAMVALMFLGTTIGGLEIGYGLWTYSTITRAAHLGARYADVHSNDTSGAVGRARLAQEIEHIVRSNADDLRGETLNVVTTWPTQNSPDAAVKVRVTYPVRFFTGSLVFSSERMSGVVPSYKMVATN